MTERDGAAQDEFGEGDVGAGDGGDGDADQGRTEPAGAGLSDAEMAAQVAGQTASDLKAKDVFEREAHGSGGNQGAVASERSIADASADELAEPS